MKNIFLIFLFALIGLTGKAQLVKSPIIIETKVHTGMNLPLYKAINYLIRDDVYAFDLSLSFPTYGRNWWEKLYNYPRTGVGFSYWSLGNDEVFGKAYTLNRNIDIPLFKRAGRFSLYCQAAFGGAYFTKIFDINENHLNRAIGSHTNIYICMGLDGKIRVFPRCEMIIEAVATHFSNGKIKSPNYGINAGTFTLGFNYLLNNDSIKIKDPAIPVIDKWYVQSVISSVGMKVYDNLNGKRYFISSVTYNIERYMNSISKIGLGADFFYDGSIREALADENGIPEKDFKKLVQFGLHTSYSIRYKKTTVSLQIGYHLYYRCTNLSLIYNRISMQYQLTKNLFGSIAIKSHLGKADFMEWGLGYSW